MAAGKCPKCGSSDTGTRYFVKTLAYAFDLGMTIAGWKYPTDAVGQTDTYRCNKCGHTWK